jgi:hypothetical protein
MTLYIIRGDTVAALAAPPQAFAEDELVIQSLEDLEASTLSRAQLTRIWNALPGATPVTRFQDRAAAVRRVWAALLQLPVDPGPAEGSSTPRPGSKQALVIELLQRSEGATVAEVMSATGWQPHTVRGLLSGTLKKKLGLAIVSEKADRGRVYRIAAEAAA